MVDANLKRKTIRIFTDSLSCLSQLQSLPTKPKLVHKIIDNTTKNIRKLTKQRNELHLHFIPSHVDIGKSDEVDELAKKAAEDGADVEIDHLPVLSSYKLHFRKTSKENLLQYLFENVRPSSNDLNFSRKAFCPQWDSESRTEIDRYAEETDTHPLVNRARTGHSLARAHLYHIKMEDDNTCRHCEDDIETIQHQILSCPKLATNNTLQTALRQYAPADLTEDSFEDWIWTAELRQITRLLLAARHAGCHI